MKNILLIISLMMSIFTFSQSYPILETDSTGKKYVIFTYEQAQKIDNSFELIYLLEKAGSECDSTVLSYIKVVDKLETHVKELETNIILHKGQIRDKDNQVSNLTERLKNSENDTKLSQDQIKTRDNQIELLKDEVSNLKTKRNIAYGAGALGIIIGVLVIIFIQ